MPSAKKSANSLIKLVQVPSWNDPRGNLFVFEKGTALSKIKCVYCLTNTAENH